MDVDVFSDDKTLPDFMDLPLEKILEHLDWAERASLRKVNHTLRHLIDNSEYIIKSLHFATTDDTRHLILNGSRVCYIERGRNHCEVQNGFNDPRTRHGISSSFRHQALLDLKTILVNPNLFIEDFQIRLGEDFENARKRRWTCNTIAEMFASFGRFLNVKRFMIAMRHGDELLTLIPYLRPGTLTHLDLNYIRSPTCQDAPEVKIDELLDTEQWKQAEHSKSLVVCSSFHIEKFLHFRTSLLCIETVSSRDVYLMRDVFLDSPNFGYCQLRVSVPFDNFQMRRLAEKGPYFDPKTKLSLYVEFDGLKNKIIFRKE